MADESNFERTERAFDTKNTVKDDSKSKAQEGDESLLELDPQEAAKRMLKDWDSSWKAVSRYTEQWKVNRARSQGFIGVQLIKKQDRMQAYIPTGAKKGVAGMNKAARLSRRLRAAIFSDPPKAEATPSTDSDEDRDAAEMSTRVLDDVCSEGNLAYNLHAGDAFDLGSDYGSGFIRFWVDETGGGWRPKEIQASPDAVDPSDPFPIGPDGQPKPVDPITRYVTDDGQFTKDKSKAAREWLPRVKDEVLSGKQVRFLPTDIRDIWEADGVQIGTAVTLGELKRLFPEIGKWDDGRLTKLCGARPQHFRDILEPHQKDTASENVSNGSLVFVLTRYQTQSGIYPRGAYLIAAGEDELLHRNIWFDERSGTPLDIPVTQFKQFTEEGNPYGEGSMTGLGPGNEIRGAMLEAMLEHLRRFQNRLTFVPMTSPLQPQQLQSPTGTPIPILPGGEPKYEEVPDFPVIVEKMERLVSLDMDDESGLQQVGQALQSPNVKSAKHAQINLEQVTAQLSDLRQNTERGLVRGWRIILQLIRAYYGVPQQISWLGDDGRYKQQRWTATDLGSTRDVRIQRGTFTQMTPQAKALQAVQFHQLGMLSPFDLEHVTESTLGGLFGLQDNPHRLRVRRQIAQWNDGPPKDFQPQPQLQLAAPHGVMPPASPADMPAQLQGSQAMPGVSVGSGAPVQPPGPPPNPYAPILSQIFQPTPADDEQQVALLRMYELGRAMASTKFRRWNQAWAQGLVLAYGMARQAAQVPDAKLVGEMQKQLQQTKQELQDAKLKLGEAHVSFSGKMADLDEEQTRVVLLKEGIQVPPRSRPVEGKEPGVPPELQLAHERELQMDKLAADSHNKRIQASADIEKEKIRSTAKMQIEEKNHAREAMLIRKLGKKDKAPKK